jgi:hypothetical protein
MVPRGELNMERRIDDIFDWIDVKGKKVIAIILILSMIYFLPAIVEIFTR